LYVFSVVLELKWRAKKCGKNDAMLSVDPQIVNSEINHDELVFANIANDICALGFSVQNNAIPQELSIQLWQYVQSLAQYNFKKAGIGRNNNFKINNAIRSDAISWIVEAGSAQKEWLTWADRLRARLNQELFLGLKNFESHFSHYSKGDYYKPHYDAFNGASNRKLSIIAYLNPEWTKEDAGEFILYTDANQQSPIKVQPLMGRVVVFLSDTILHEVKAPNKDRYSIAGWFSNN
jgi:SM-20-related protein